MDRETLIALAMPTFFLGLAVLSLWWFFRLRVKGRMAATWPIASATITKSEIASWVTSRGGYRYDAEIRYSYSVGGERYEGSRISFGDAQLTRAAARATTDRYPAGSVHLVRYNPEKPQEAVLELAPLANGPLFLAGSLAAGALLSGYLATI